MIFYVKKREREQRVEFCTRHYNFVVVKRDLIDFSCIVVVWQQIGGDDILC